MTPAERLYTAVSGGLPDRIPFVPKLWVDSAARLTGTDLLDVVEDPLRALSVIVEAGRRVGADGVRQFHFPPRRTESKDGRVWEIGPGGRILGRIDLEGGLATLLDDAADFSLEDPVHVAYYQYRHSPETLVKSARDAARIRIPDQMLFDQLGWGINQARAAERAGPDLPLIADCGSLGISFAAYWNGMEKTLFDLTDDPDTVRALLEKGVALAAEKGRYWIDRGFRVLRINDSAGNMSVISPVHWREFVFPCFKTLVDELRRYEPSCRLYCHICGNILPILEDLVETGLDCIGPLDPLGGFTCLEARGRVGDSVALMGGINTLSFVESTPAEIALEAEACIAGAGPKGFILGSGCVVPRGVREENLLAVARLVREPRNS
jgi:hypothetical protein